MFILSSVIKHHCNVSTPLCFTPSGLREGQSASLLPFLSLNFTMSTYAKCFYNPNRMNTYRSLDLKL